MKPSEYLSTDTLKSSDDIAQRWKRTGELFDQLAERGALTVPGETVLSGHPPRGVGVREEASPGGGVPRARPGASPINVTLLEDSQLLELLTSTRHWLDHWPSAHWADASGTTVPVARGTTVPVARVTLAALLDIADRLRRERDAFSRRVHQLRRTPEDVIALGVVSESLAVEPVVQQGGEAEGLGSTPKQNVRISNLEHQNDNLRVNNVALRSEVERLTKQRDELKRDMGLMREHWNEAESDLARLQEVARAEARPRSPRNGLRWMASDRVVSDAPKILGREMTQRGTQWLVNFGPLEYVIETAQPNIQKHKCITWIYYDYATTGARCAGRSVPIIGPLHWCIAAIERELLSIHGAISESIRAAIPGKEET